MVPNTLPRGPLAEPAKLKYHQKPSGVLAQKKVGRLSLPTFKGEFIIWLLAILETTTKGACSSHESGGQQEQAGRLRNGIGKSAQTPLVNILKGRAIRGVSGNCLCPKVVLKSVASDCADSLKEGTATPHLEKKSV
jgi:hypothetical protein